MNVDYSIPNKVVAQGVHTPSQTALECFFYATVAGHFQAVPSYYVKRSGYNLLLLGYTVGGEGFLEYKGESYKLKKGDLFIIDCNEYQHYRTAGEVWDFYWVHIGGAAAYGYYKIIAENRGNVFRCPQNFIDYWELIYKTMGKGGFDSEPSMSLQIHELLTAVLMGDRGAKSFTKVERLIKERYMQRITLDEMAGEQRMSKYHFSRSFKAETGFSPYEYLIKYRLNAAKRLLLGSDLAVDEIALSCGFESVSNFIGKFKRTVGMTPGAYRKDSL